MQKLTFTQAVRRTTEEKEFFSLGCTPTEEICTPAGERLGDALIECKVLANQLIRLYGEPPAGTEFFIVENYHDFGIYYELNIWFIPDINTDFIFEGEPDELQENPSQEYANKCENLPDHWDMFALEELRKAGHSQHQPAKVIRLKTA